MLTTLATLLHVLQALYWELKEFEGSQDLDMDAVSDKVSILGHATT